MQSPGTDVAGLQQLVSGGPLAQRGDALGGRLGQRPALLHLDPDRAGGHDLEAGEVQLDGTAGRSRCREQLPGVAEGRGRARADEPLEAEDAAVAKVHDGLVDRREIARTHDVADPQSKLKILRLSIN